MSWIPYTSILFTHSINKDNGKIAPDKRTVETVKLIFIRSLLALLLVLASWSLLFPTVQAQSEISPEVGVTVELLESRIREVESSSELDEESKKSLLDLYRKSLSQIEQRQSYETATARFAEALESAPKQSAVLREELQALEAEEPQQLSEPLLVKDLPALEQQLLGEDVRTGDSTTRLLSGWQRGRLVTIG